MTTTAGRRGWRVWRRPGAILRASRRPLRVFGGHRSAPRFARPRVADVINLHGLWHAAIWAAAAEARRAHRPYVLSPRGMLSPAALAHDAWRKRVAYIAFDRAVIRGAAMLHATSRPELDELTSRFGANRTCYVPNGVALPPPVTIDPCETRRQWVVFCAFVCSSGASTPST